MLLGDNIYADTLNAAAIASMYAQMQSRPAYARLAATMPVIAIYDDHDFAFNDAKGAHVPPAHRDSSQQVPSAADAKRGSARAAESHLQMLLDFQGVDALSPRRRRQGSYERCGRRSSACCTPRDVDFVARSFVMGPPHERVAVVLLDTRYLRVRALPPLAPIADST